MDHLSLGANQFIQGLLDHTEGVPCAALFQQVAQEALYLPSTRQQQLTAFDAAVQAANGSCDVIPQIATVLAEMCDRVAAALIARWLPTVLQDLLSGSTAIACC